MQSTYRALLKKYRKQAGMTQGELAEKVGVKLSKISHLLGWDNQPSKSQLNDQRKADELIRRIGAAMNDYMA